MNRILVSSIALIMLAYGLCWPTIINIPADYPTIQQGIDASADGDTVLVQPGTYVENINFNGHNIMLGSLFLMTGDTSYIVQTVIDGDSAGSVVTFENLENNAAVICGYTIQNGFARFGGGFYCRDSSPKILSNIITDNIASDSLGMNGIGGGIFCWDCPEPLIENNIIIENLAGSDSAGRAGGICFYGPSNGIFRGNLVFRNATSRDNSPYTQASTGGGIQCISSDPSIIDNVITENESRECGGGILLWNSSATVIGNLIKENIVDLDGGGIGVVGGVPTIEENTIINNESGYTGGGIFLLASDAMISNNVLVENRSTLVGGGINCFQESNATLQGNLIIKNKTGRYGGGVSIGTESNPQLNHNTFYLNSASLEGGGIYCGYLSNPVIINTILWADSAPINNEIYIDGGAPTFTFCDIEGGWPGEGNIDCCPGFCSTPIGDYYLIPSSCCLGTGSGGDDIGAFGLGCDSLTPNCNYVTGDVNGSSNYNGLDITYGVSYLKGGAPPVYECECTSCNIWYSSGDVNGSCSYNGLDITYGVSYLKGIQTELFPCPDCPPVN
jgi:hypothetical protein